MHCSVYWIHNLSGFAVKYLGPKSSFFALSNSRFQIVWYISGVQKDGIHGNQKRKMTGSCYTAQWRWIVFLGGLCNNGQKGGVKPEGGHHVNYSLKGGGGALWSYLKKRVSLYKKKVTNGVSVPPIYRNCHKVLRPFSPKSDRFDLQDHEPQHKWWLCDKYNLIRGRLLHKMEIISLRAGTLLPDLYFCQDVSFSDQAPVFQAFDNAIHRLNLRMAADKCLGN